MSLTYDPPALLAHLIEHGFAPESELQNLRPEWQAAFDAVRAVRGDRAARQAAFDSSVASVEHGSGVKAQLNFARSMPFRRYPRDMRTAADMIGSDPVTDWLVDGLFTIPSLNLLVGAPGAKKTLLSLDLAVCVAMGKPWLTRSTRQSTVLYLDEETGLAQLWPRLQAALRAHAAPPSTPLNFVALPRFDLRYHSDCEELKQMALDAKAGFVIIDALADITASASENSSKSMLNIFANLRRISYDCAATFLVIHHTNKAGSYRGSTAIAGGVDLLLFIESAHASPLVKIDPQKGRSFLPSSFVARVDFKGDQAIFSLSREKRVRKLGKNHRAILQLISDRGPSTHADLVAHMVGLEPATIRRAVHDLRGWGLLERDEFGGNPALSSLTHKGRDYLKLAH